MPAELTYNLTSDDANWTKVGLVRDNPLTRRLALSAALLATPPRCPLTPVPKAAGQTTNGFLRHKN
jgi:hypothetical protein